MRFASLLACFALAFSVTACSRGELVGAGPEGGGGDGGTHYHPGQDGSTLPPGVDGSTTNNGCPSGEHMAGGTCVADEVTCAAEFPCPSGQQCVGGRCINTPGGCTSNQDCPTGYTCSNGTCVAECAGNGTATCSQDSDCPSGNLCVSCQCVGVDACATPTADIGTPTDWSVTQDLHLSKALGTFWGAFFTVAGDLADAINGCPNGGTTCFLLETFVVPLLPPWLDQLIQALADVGSFLDNDDFFIDSTFTFQHVSGSASNYTGNDHWNRVRFSYMGMQFNGTPQQAPFIMHSVDSAFTASTVCGVLYVDKHEIDGVIQGFFRWVINTILSITTQGQCNDLGQCIEGAIDCSQIQDLAGQAACYALVDQLGQKIDDALNNWLLNYSLLELQGTATVQDGHNIVDGHWDGTIGSVGFLFDNFPGEWSGTR